LNAEMLGDPNCAKSVDSALKVPFRASCGPTLIGLVAGGLFCFALLSLCKKYVRLL